MKYSKLVLALAATGLMSASATLSADDMVFQPWHVTGQVGAYDTDNDRNSRDGDVWWGVGFGRFFGEHFSLDLEYDEFTGDFQGVDDLYPGATFSDWKLANVGLMGRYHFFNGNFRPFLAGGLGALTHRRIGDEGTGLSLSYGLGATARFAEHWSGRVQWIMRKDVDGASVPYNESYTDSILSIGLSYDFGGKAPPPPPPAEPPPPPPPPPNPDLDGDGVLNEHDKCPDTRPGAVVDLDGCEVEAVIELPGVYFDFDKATLKPEAKVVLNEAAALLNQHERVVVEVAGHTDSTGSDAYNQGLSERRANAVADYLSANADVPRSVFTTSGMGESQPVATNETAEGRQLNRRVEITIE